MTTTQSLELELDSYRRELTAYCYRMLGSSFEAEDAVQETLIRAWKNMETFEGRSALRSWLYRIATNVCLDMLRSSQRRARPMDLGPAMDVQQALQHDRTPENLWIEPIQDTTVIDLDGDPADVVTARESVRLAFVAALQHLPARQRAVLILREVLKWQASEVAELLETTVASVNSALQRARATLDAVEPDADARPSDVDEALVAKYAEAFQNYDVASLVTLLHDDVHFSMPPYPMWLNDPAVVGEWMLGPGIGCKGSRLLPLTVNGQPAFASYRKAEPGVHEPWSIQVLETSGGKITELHNFLDTRLFPLFGLPPRLLSRDDV